MKLWRVMAAYVAVEQLKSQEWDYAFALAIYRTKKALADDATFFASEERKLIDKYAARDESGAVKMAGNNAFIFADPALHGEYAERRLMLCETESILGYEPIHVTAPERIRPAHIEALEGFIVFDTGGEK